MSEETSVKSYNVLKEFGDHHIGEVVEASALNGVDVEALVVDGILEEVVASEEGEAKVGDACVTEDGRDGTISEEFVCVATLGVTPAPEPGAELPGASEQPPNGARHPLA